MKWYLKVLGQYADFNGRARRMEYWMFVLFNLIFSVAAMMLDQAVASNSGDVGFFYVIYALAVFIPNLAVGVRRLHDVGKSGWMLLVSLIPLIGAIWLFVLFVTDSEPGANEYGANPKNPEVDISEHLV